jgi:hypothetical protein
VVFGFSYQSAGALVEFLKVHRHDLRQVTGVRYSGGLGHPFHVVDDETVVLPLDDPFVKEGRFASLLVRDRELADSLAEGFQELWPKAMKNLREITFGTRGEERHVATATTGWMPLRPRSQEPHTNARRHRHGTAKVEKTPNPLGTQRRCRAGVARRRWQIRPTQIDRSVRGPPSARYVWSNARAPRERWGEALQNTSTNGAIGTPPLPPPFLRRARFGTEVIRWTSLPTSCVDEVDNRHQGTPWPSNPNA